MLRPRRGASQAKVLPMNAVALFGVLVVSFMIVTSGEGQDEGRVALLGGVHGARHPLPQLPS